MLGNIGKYSDNLPGNLALFVSSNICFLILQQILNWRHKISSFINSSCESFSS